LSKPRGEFPEHPKNFSGACPEMLALTLNYLGVSPRCLPTSSGMLFSRLIGVKTLEQGFQRYPQGSLHNFSPRIRKPAEFEYEVRAQPRGAIFFVFLKNINNIPIFRKPSWAIWNNYGRIWGIIRKKSGQSTRILGISKFLKPETPIFPTQKHTNPEEIWIKCPYSGNFRHLYTQNG
jgi:hypothetical protein